MWREVSLLGRDRLLVKEIYPRARGKKPPFLLTGPLGVGKSGVFEWAYQNASGRKAFVSAASTVREILIGIVRGWGLTLGGDGKGLRPERAPISLLEIAIMEEEEGKIFLDDIQRSTPALLRRLKVWRERFTVYACGVPPFNKEELKRNLWGLKEIEIEPLNEDDRLKLAQQVCIAIGSDKSPTEVAQASRGFPGRIVAMALGEVEHTSPRVRGEEIDLSPILILLLVGVVALRYIGIGLSDTSLYILGGLGMGLMIFFRFFLWRGMSER